MSRCPSTAEGNRCIYDEGHDDAHFAKDSDSYFSWLGEWPPGDERRRDALEAADPAVLMKDPWTRRWHLFRRVRGAR